MKPAGSNDWCEAIYDAKAAELLLYGRALGLSHCEAEDVLQETFLILMEKPLPPARSEHYCVRSYSASKQARATSAQKRNSHSAKKNGVSG